MTHRKNKGRSSVRRVAPALALALASFLCAGCSQEASPAKSAPAAPAAVASAVVGTAAFDAAASFTKTEGSLSLHERVMAEQGRGTGVVAADTAATTPSTNPPRSEVGLPRPEIGLPRPEAGPAQSEISPPGAAAIGEHATTAAVLGGGRTPLKGVWSGTVEQLTTFLARICPSPRFTVPPSVLAEYYLRYSGEAGLRADLLWAQMLHETGYGMYGGDVQPEQNNYAGIGATGDGPGVTFATADAGVMAHIAHMVAYVYVSSPVGWADSATDPRFDLVEPRGAASVLADLNGRWAVPGSTYGQAIEAIALAINAR